MGSGIAKILENEHEIKTSSSHKIPTINKKQFFNKAIK
jgi:hypothetical protein